MHRLMMVAVATLGVAACSNNDSGSPVKRVSADGMTTTGIVTDGAQHVAYLLNAGASFGTTGDLHMADKAGKDVKIATGIGVGSYAFSADGKGFVFLQPNQGGNDASLQWVDVANPTTPPKAVIATGLQLQSMPPIPVPLSSQGFFSPSGRFYVVGVLAPNVSVSPDLHVIDLDTGNDVFTRDNGAFDYLELVLPNDVMVFQDAVGGNGGVAGGAGVQTLFWVDLTSGTPTATTIDVRTGSYTPTGDNKTIVYQRADTRELWTWDAVARPATGTKVASNALNFAVAGTGPIAYIGTDGSVHVVAIGGAAVLDVAAATAKADLFSPVYISEDGADVYYFQNVVSQDKQGTLMHVSATAGSTPSKVADAASLSDVHPQAGGVLLYLANLDTTGTIGDAFRSARDGSGAMALGTGVQVGFLQVQTPAAEGGGSAKWVSLHLVNSMENKSQKLVDGIRAITGGLELTNAAGTVTVDPMARIGQQLISDDFESLVYVGASTFDATVDNYIGALEAVPVATASTKPMKPLLTGVSEVGTVIGKSLFVNAPKADKPGVYFISF